MAINEDSVAGAVEQLNVFHTPETQVSVLGSELNTYYPVNSLENAKKVTFEVTGSDTWVDLRETYLRIVVKVVNKDGSDLGSLLTPPDKDGNRANIVQHVSLVNFPAMTIWRSMKIYLNNVMAQNIDDFGYASFLGAMLKYSGGYKQSVLTMGGYYPVGDNSETRNALFFKEIAKRIGDSKSAEFVSPFTCGGLFSCNRLIVPHCGIRIELHLQDDAFSLLNYTPAHEVKLQLLECTLHVRKVRVIDSLSMALTQHHQTEPMKYPHTRVVMRAAHIGQGTRFLTNTLLFKGVSPVRMFAVLVRADSYDGSAETNPMVFRPAQVRSIVVRNGDRNYPVTGGNEMFEFDKENRYALAYLRLVRALQIKDGVGDMSYDDFKNFAAIYAFDLSQSEDAAAFELTKYADTSIAISFDGPLAYSYMLIVAAEFQAKLLLTSDHNPVVDVMA